jgi:hypothetical protein
MWWLMVFSFAFNAGGAATHSTSVPIGTEENCSIAANKINEDYHVPGSGMYFEGGTYFPIYWLKAYCVKE